MPVPSPRRWSRVWVPAVVAGGVTSAVSPLVRRLMLHQGVLDTPTHRSSHSTPIPRGGGWSCLLGGAAGLVAAQLTTGKAPWRTGAAVLALAMVGAADDRWSLSAAPRLAAQGSAGLAADLASGTAPLGVVTVPVVVNVVNFMDGINGMTALTTAVWGVNAATLGQRSGNEHLALLGAITAGMSLGFLPHNLRDDRMFLGDVGSYLVGAVMALTFLHPSLPLRTRLVVLAPLLPYFADTGTTLLRRLMRGVNVLEAHREHAYQRLANEGGLGHVPVSAMFAGVSALLALSAQVAFEEE